MPSAQAHKLCPDGIFVRGRMARYAEISKLVREVFESFSPIVEPLSLDEAFLDLSGTERLHGVPPAAMLAKLARKIENEIGISVSIGLSFNRFLAKLASEIDKPRGFAVIGRLEARTFLRDMPVSLLRGAGNVLQARMARDGFTRIGQTQDAGRAALVERYGSTGSWLFRLANAEDSRRIDPLGARKTLSSETTFATYISSRSALERILWEQSERVAAQAKRSDFGGYTIVLKLKTKGFVVRTRSITLERPTQLAENIFRVAREELKSHCDGTQFRLLGVGLTKLCDASACDLPDLDAQQSKRIVAERAVDRVRERFGRDSVRKGRSVSAVTTRR